MQQRYAGVKEPLQDIIAPPQPQAVDPGGVAPIAHASDLKCLSQVCQETSLFLAHRGLQPSRNKNDRTKDEQVMCS
jgi:hypothetical protein